jgi:hypothetical protein
MCASQILWRRIKLMGDDYDIRGTMRLEKFIQINPRPIYKHSLQYLVIAHHSNLLNKIIEKIVKNFPNIIHLDLG